MISYSLNESLANRYGGSSSAKLVKKAFEFQQIEEALQDISADSIEADCAVVFSDISGFSKRVAAMNPLEIKEFLEDYYKKIIPIIYRHGGLIDQMFGDGIISVFCSELSREITDPVFRTGLKAAEEIVATFAGDVDCSTKCALHKERAVICQIGDENYRQATIVGNIMTAVHRVESVAVDEAVNMLLSIPEAGKMFANVIDHTLEKVLSGVTLAANWNLSSFKADLKGIGNGPHDILIEKYIA